MKIEGVPDGWEPVAFCHLSDGDEYICPDDGTVVQWVIGRRSVARLLKVRRIEPHCTWQHGQFKDGWIAEDDLGLVWYRDRPEFLDRWIVRGGPYCAIGRCLFNPPIFRSSLPYNERIQQVGPTYEATLRGETC